MIMKIKRSELKKIILEEIAKSVEAQEVDEGFGKSLRNAALGAAMGLGAMTGTAKAADRPVTGKDDNLAAIGYIHDASEQARQSGQGAEWGVKYMYARAVLSDQMKLEKVPQNIRDDVETIVDFSKQKMTKLKAENPERFEQLKQKGILASK
jgi:hypothetical protein